MSKRKFQIDKLIINSPYEEPRSYWRYAREDQTFERVEYDRRPAGYVVATPFPRPGKRTREEALLHAPGAQVPRLNGAPAIDANPWVSSLRYDR